MFSPDEYELIDFGHGRKLERFAKVVLDRPSPAAEEQTPAVPDVWNQATARYQRTRDDAGTWQPDISSKPWTMRHGQAVFTLKATPFGHLGVFPEQAANWDWIDRRVRGCATPPKVLNLFAYTGGSTMAAALAGAAEVVHVDAAKNTVAWARENAVAAGLSDAPIRWIVEDATRFVEREVRRGNQYDAVILDPPSYGHGPKGEPWKLNEDLLSMLKSCAQLTEKTRDFVLLTCHSPGFGAAEAEASLAQTVFGHCGAGAVAQKMSLRTANGRQLNAGIVARWPD